MQSKRKKDHKDKQFPVGGNLQYLVLAIKLKPGENYCTQNSDQIEFWKWGDSTSGTFPQKSECGKEFFFDEAHTTRIPTLEN